VSLVSAQREAAVYQLFQVDVAPNAWQYVNVSLGGPFDSSLVVLDYLTSSLVAGGQISASAQFDSLPTQDNKLTWSLTRTNSVNSTQQHSICS